MDAVRRPQNSAHAFLRVGSGGAAYTSQKSERFGKEKTCMKKRIFAALASIALLSGCADVTELGDRALIQAAAVDCDDSGYHVSCLLFSSGGSGGDTIDASQENVIKVTGDGDTLAQAFDNVSLIDGKKLYLSEMKLLVLGSGFTNRDLSSAANTLFYDMGCSLNMPVCCADRAEMLTDLRFTEGITSAEKPLDMMKNAYREGVSPDATLLDLMCGIESGRSVLIPMFVKAENGFGQTSDDSGKTAALAGTRLVKDGVLSDYYDSEKTAGLMLLSGETDRMTLYFRYEGEEQTCEAYRIKTRPVKQQSGQVISVSARFRGRNGAELSEEMKQAALNRLTDIVKGALLA